MMKALLYLSLLLILLPCLEKSQASKIQFQTFDMSHHLSSASICNRASRTGFKNRLRTTTILEVVQRHNPCAQTKKNRPTNLPYFAKILANDRLRVESIQARVVKHVDSINTNKYPNKSCRDKRAQIPAQSGDLLDSGNYIVTIGLGTPKRNLSLVFDTGSFLTWTQCKPCRHCYRQHDKIFNPSTSTTYSNISCKSKDCPHPNFFFGCYNKTTCAYGLKYGDQSYTNGFLSKDKLTVTQNNVFDGFLFGCGQNNSGLFGLTDGLLGLSRGRLSFVSQTANFYNKYFSYCLPSTINSIGFLAFGKNNTATKRDDDAMIFTDLIPPPQDVPPIYYFIEITAISVGGTPLTINGSIFKKSGTLIDSGTVITRLPLAAYKTMSKKFKNQMNKLNYKSAPAFSLLDTCFHIPQHTTTVKTPSVSFTFKGNAAVDLDPSGILYVFNSTYACLAFAGNSDPEDFAIFGNTQQKKFEVAYDVAGNKLGFAHNPLGCQ